jgi:dTDP-4-amino-4,6-dideoxygalactose transaminase
VSIAAPWLPPWEQVVERFADIWRAGRLTNGACVERLECEAAAYLGVPDCVAVSSCTAGLMLVARCLGLRGEVILPSFTFFATGHALRWNGLTPVFADCDPQTFNIDPGSVARVWTRDTSAVVGVHIFGCPADVDALQSLTRSRGVPLVFDGAHAFGARVRGASVAAWGDATVFSLAATKPLVAGEGGLIATADPVLASSLRQARNYGNDGSYDCPALGLNARMTELQAAMALAGLTYLEQGAWDVEPGLPQVGGPARLVAGSLPFVEEGIERRRRLAALYRQSLAEAPGLKAQQPGREARSSWTGFALQAGSHAAIDREALERSLAAAGIETRRYYDPPLHRQKLYRRFYRPSVEPLAVTDALSSQVVSLPLHAGLQPETVQRIARLILALRRPRQPVRALPTAARATG